MDAHTYQLTFIVTFACISIIAVSKSRHIRSADDFAMADRSLSATGVSWIIIGTLAGGVSTIGTVQTAYPGFLMSSVAIRQSFIFFK